MKKTILLIITLCMLSAVQGQERGNRGDRLEKLDELVSLTDEQKEKITVLNESFKQEMKMLRESDNPDYDKMFEMREQHKTNVSNVLTTEQQQKLKEAPMEKKKEHKKKKFKEKAQMKDKVKAERVSFNSNLSTQELEDIESARAIIKKQRESESSAEKGSRKNIPTEASSLLKPIASKHETAIDQSIEKVKSMKSNDGGKKMKKDKADTNKAVDENRKRYRFLLIKV